MVVSGSSLALRGTVANRVTQLAIGLALVLAVVGCAGGGGSGRAPQGGNTEDPRATFAKLELSPTKGSGAKGSAAFAKAAARTRIELELRGLPEPGETYLAHIHPGTCEDEQHAEAPGGEGADHHEDGHAHQEHSGAIGHPLTPVESDARGEGSSTTVLEGVAPDELFPGGSRYLNVHAAGSGDPPQLACADLGGAS
jgi:Cu/Zn superoxide dismutase